MTNQYFMCSNCEFIVENAYHDAWNRNKSAVNKEVRLLDKSGKFRVENTVGLIRGVDNPNLKLQLTINTLFYNDCSYYVFVIISELIRMLKDKIL